MCRDASFRSTTCAGVSTFPEREIRLSDQFVISSASQQEVVFAVDEVHITDIDRVLSSGEETLAKRGDDRA